MGYRLLSRFENNETEIYLLGSLHHMHNNLPYFGYQHLRAALLNLNPDVLLIESRQEEIERGNLADGPLEMFYLHMSAIELGIPVKGVDWISYNESKPGSTNKVRDGKIHNCILKYSAGHQKVLVVIGATHMLIEAKKLNKQGYVKLKIQNPELDYIFRTNEINSHFPDETSKYLDIRIEREKEVLDIRDLDDKWYNATKRVIDDLEHFKSKIS